jgi:HD-GYP domain-containing protein (c-di-GMP phosphodiesterase class II)
VRHHHEAFDGSGYPDHLRGENIPLGARIVAVAESYDNMVSDLPYRRGRSVEEAVAELRRCSGTQFAPKIVEAFLRSLEKSGPTPRWVSKDDLNYAQRKAGASKETCVSE